MTIAISQDVRPGLALCVLLAGCVSLVPPAGVKPVSDFDLQRYQGHWFEVARLDHAFERGLTDASASYAAQPDGSVRVVNRGYDPDKAKWREVVGRAWFTGPASTASLKVSFFGPFYGAYHVAALDADYRWSLVVGPDLGYCWILARERKLDDAQRQAATARARALGIDVAALVWVPQQRPDF